MALTGTHPSRRIRQNRPLEEVATQKRGRKPLKLGRFSLKGGLLYLLAGILVLALVLTASTYQANVTCKDIKIHIQHEPGQGMLSIEDVKQLIGLDYGRDIIGAKMSEVGLPEIEQALRRAPSIQHAEVYKTLGGLLKVDISLRQPIARILGSNGSFYIDASGHKFPTSRHAIVNLPLLRGSFTEKLAPHDSLSCEVEELMPLLQYLHTHPFWAAQVSEIRRMPNGDILLYPEIGTISMEIGPPIELNKKFEALKQFYDQVITRVGWKAYRSLSVKYRGQVVARKK